MDEDRPEDSSPDSGRAKRPPPTIDLEASEVSGQNQDGGGEAKARSWDFPRSSSWPFRPSWVRAISASLVAAATSAVTAAIVVAFAWVVGWPGEPPPQPANPQTNTSAIDMLGSRVSDLEERSAKPAQAVPDPALQGQIEALGKSVASLRNEMAGIRAQSEKVAAELNAVRSAPREAASPDLAAIKERLSELERAKQAESAEIAQAANKPMDDKALRRVVAASMLDVSVRQGEPFVAALAAAKALAPDPEALKALDVFAATGLPNAASLCRELLTLVPKLSPPAPQNSTTGTGIMDRLQAGAAKLVRIERTDAVGNDRSAVVARVTAAALRNDLADARRELNSLAPADRAAAQDWLDKAKEREVALASSRQFASEAMAAFAKPAQPNMPAQPNTPAQ